MLSADTSETVKENFEAYLELVRDRSRLAQFTADFKRDKDKINKVCRRAGKKIDPRKETGNEKIEKLNMLQKRELLERKEYLLKVVNRGRHLEETNDRREELIQRVQEIVNNLSSGSERISEALQDSEDVDSKFQVHHAPAASPSTHSEDQLSSPPKKLPKQKAKINDKIGRVATESEGKLNEKKTLKHQGVHIAMLAADTSETVKENFQAYLEIVRDRSRLAQFTADFKRGKDEIDKVCRRAGRKIVPLPKQKANFNDKIERVATESEGKLNEKKTSKHQGANFDLLRFDQSTLNLHNQWNPAWDPVLTPPTETARSHGISHRRMPPSDQSQSSCNSLAGEEFQAPLALARRTPPRRNWSTRMLHDRLPTNQDAEEIQEWEERAENTGNQSTWKNECEIYDEVDHEEVVETDGQEYAGAIDVRRPVEAKKDLNGKGRKPSRKRSHQTAFNPVPINTIVQVPLRAEYRSLTFAQRVGIMKKKVASCKFYDHSRYGTLHCLWHPARSLFSVQEVCAVPTRNVVYDSVETLFRNTKPNYPLEPSNHPIWEKRKKEMHALQREQWEMGLIVVRTFREKAKKKNTLKPFKM